MGVSLNQISALILLGESADNERLQKALNGALGEHVLRKQFVTLVSLAGVARETQIDPLFAAANGAAWDCLDRMKSKKVSQASVDESQSRSIHHVYAQVKLARLKMS